MKIKKGKAIPITGHGDPQGCEMLRLHFLDNWPTDGGKVVSLVCQLSFTPRKIPIYTENHLLMVNEIANKKYEIL
ncbi:hypothetical protein B7P43_G01203 [Cryptotermes secundus]|uniref:Uncharacterized protein n=1 Tax=Cryptotermes secundus TaxID=105785 RepID=A0A2J7RCU3_9NEOP|nr:hypothetical protein B7P43_G01203 [Cryptotermes secundus]